jgi:inward rectifier potassium channel
MRVRLGAFELTKRGAERFDWRDPYHGALSMTWPQFGLAFVAADLGLNLVFAILYALRPGCIQNLTPDPITGTFFFSMETLAAVGYGVAAPLTYYGHCIAALEMVVGIAFTAIITGLTFVRFSRPRARILYADNMVITPHNGIPTLMVRIGNPRKTSLVEAKASLAVLLAERSAEGQSYRRTYDLKLVRHRIPMFALTWTLMHVIDEHSPLSGHDEERMHRDDARFFLSLEARDPQLASVVHDIKDYKGSTIRWGMRYADAVSFDEHGRTIADLTRVSLLEPEPERETVGEMEEAGAL